MVDILLFVSNGLIIISLILYFLLVIISRKKITDNNGFNITKDIISEYNSINVIESKSFFTVYNIKRKVIKLSSKCYYGNKLSDISLSILEAAISLVDSMKNKYIDLFRKFFNNLKILYIFPIFAVIINSVSYNMSDAKVSLIFIFLFTIITYMFVDIKSNAWLWINENISKVKDISDDSKESIINFINKILLIDKMIFVGELIILIRMFSILFNF